MLGWVKIQISVILSLQEADVVTHSKIKALKWRAHLYFPDAKTSLVMMFLYF